MTPKEKAEDLVKKFFIYNHLGHKHAVRYALIAVDEIMNALCDNGSWDSVYWESVKQEIKRYESV